MTKLEIWTVAGTMGVLLLMPLVIWVAIRAAIASERKDLPKS